jgi:HEAT repeat protein
MTGLAGTSDTMRPRVEAGPEYAAVLAAEIVEALQVELFPADASSLASQFARYEAIAADTSADHVQRSRALDAAAQLAHRADDPNITARLVDSTLAYAGQIEDALLNSTMFARIASQVSASDIAAVRAQFADAPAGILGLLSGIGDARVIRPMSEALLYDQSEAVRRVAAGIVGEFVDDAVARAALESAAEFDVSAAVRETASNYLLDDALHIESLFAGVRDSSLSDEERLRPITYVDRLQFIEQGFSVDADTVDVVAELIERSDVAWRLDVLFGLSMYRSPSFVPVYLERLSNDPSPDVRILLLDILSEHRSQPGVDAALEAAADDPVDNVRAKAARVLEDVNP